MAINVQGLQGHWNQLKGEREEEMGTTERGRPEVVRRQY